MNAICRDLFTFLRIRFPDVENKVFEILINNTLNGRKIDENLNNMSQKTAESLKSHFSGMSASGLEEILAGVVGGKKGRFQRLLEKPMFYRKP